MCDWQVKVLGRNRDDRPAALEASFPTGSRCDIARVFVVPTEDGRYALSPEIGLDTAGHGQGPAHAVVTVSGPGHRLIRVVRDHSHRLFGLDVVGLLERLSRSGLVVAWLHQTEVGNNGPTDYTMPSAEKAGG